MTDCVIPLSPSPTSRDTEGVPDVRTTPPGAPGSETSLTAALTLDSPFRRKSWRLLMLTLAASDRPMSMYELHERTGLPVNVICGRLSELRPMWVEQHKGACWSHVKSNLRVDGFTLTEAGKARVKAAA